MESYCQLSCYQLIEPGAWAAPGGVLCWGRGGKEKGMGATPANVGAVHRMTSSLKRLKYHRILRAHAGNYNLILYMNHTSKLMPVMYLNL